MRFKKNVISNNEILKTEISKKETSKKWDYKQWDFKKKNEISNMISKMKFQTLRKK